jgi:hypothetical protein
MYEGPKKVSYSVSVDDWRIQEMWGYDPKSVMDDLLEIADGIYQARLDVGKHKRDVADLEEQLKRRKMQILVDIQEGDDQELKDRLLKGGTKGERAQLQEHYLDGLEEMRLAVAEIGIVRELLDSATAEQDALIDRQGNLRAWSRMFERQCQLLSSVYVPKPWEVPVEVTAESALTPEAKERIRADIDEMMRTPVRGQALAQAVPDATKAAPEVGLEEGKPVHEDPAVQAADLTDEERSVVLGEYKGAAKEANARVQEAVERHAEAPPTFADDNEPVKTAL